MEYTPQSRALTKAVPSSLGCATVAGQEKNGKRFTGEQRQWLEAIRDHVAASLTIEPDDFEFEPFVQRG